MKQGPSREKPRISIVACFNNLQILEANLLESLSDQNEPFELILVDNTKMKFKSLPIALNLGGNNSSGDYIMFVHQDVYLRGKNWLCTAIHFIESLPDIGAAGVSGVSKNGKFVGFILDRGRYWGKPIKQPVTAQTLDEQLVIIPRWIFDAVHFDERFRFHSYIVDYCLTLQEKGYTVYVLPLTVEHNSVTIGIRRVSPIETDDRLLYLKHKHFFESIHKTTGVIDVFYQLRKKAASIFSNFYLMAMKYSFEFLGGHFAGRILDFGCVPGEQLYLMKLLENKGYSVGVSDKKRYVLVSKQLKVHDDYVIAKLEKLPFKGRVFDATILFGILEYVSKKETTNIVYVVEKIGKKVMVKVPYRCSPIFLPLLFDKKQAYSVFHSCWDVADFQKRGYKTLVFGVKNLTPLMLFAVR
ncbi:MAG: glycosyltransferase [Candidatus Bathyarchaeia archaeon]